MTDYDGADILKTYLTGLTWTGLNEPNYYEFYEREKTTYPNAIVIREVNINFEQQTENKLRWTHTLEVDFTSTTKVLAFANLKYVVDNIFKYSNAVNAMQVSDCPIVYHRKRKIFTLNVIVQELKSIT